MKAFRPAIVLALALGSLISALPSRSIGAAAASSTTTSIARLIPTGTTTLGGQNGNAGSITEGTTNEIRTLNIVDRLIPHSGLSAARVPSDHVPMPAGNALASANPGFSGFNGLSHRDQRFAGTGHFTNTQFSLEPPDQALCAGNGFVLETVNTALQVYNASTGAPVSGTLQPINQFFHLAPEIIRSSPPVFGDFTGDPKCYYDAPTNRWFLTVIQLDINSSTGVPSGRTHIELAVSQTGDSTGTWNLFSLDTTDDGNNGTPSHANCPCLGDQPLIGADASGFYVSTNEFSLFGSAFNGAQIYAMSKTALAAGTLPTVVQINAGELPTPDAGGIWFSIQPATTPPGGAYVPNTEYFLSALDFSGTLDNRIAVWALTNTSSLSSATPAVGLTNLVLASEVYGQPPDAQQQPGPMPLASIFIPQLLGGKTPPTEKLELLAANDDRMNQVVFANGRLWAGVNTVVKTPNGPTRVGTAYFIVTPSLSSGSLEATMANQGYVAVNQENVLFPSIGVNSAGKGVMTFTLVGPDFFPSAAYASIDAVNGAGAVHIAGPGAGPEDGFTGYGFFGGSRTARWGDYSAAVADAAGAIWLGVEYIPNAPRSVLANWGTFVSHVTP